MTNSTDVLLGCVLSFGLILHAGVDAQEGRGGVLLHNDCARLRLGDNGKVVELSALDGTNLLADAKGAPFMFVHIGAQWHEAVSLHAVEEGNGWRLRVGFRDADVVAEVIMRARAMYFEAEAVSLGGAGKETVQEWVFVNTPVSIKANLSGWLNIAWDEKAAAAVIALEERTKVGGAPTLRATGLGRVGFSGRKAAIIACPTPQMLGILRAIEQEHKLPSPTLGGQWAKTSQEARKSWMITGLTASGEPEAFAPNRIFELAKNIGAGYVVICLHWWNTGFGHYQINTSRFPRGIASLKEAADKAHAQGLKLGIHVMTASITKNDPYVTPTPDPRLRKDGEVTLGSDVDVTATEIATLESPAAFGTASGYWAFGGTDVQIDEEVICYSGIRDAAPFALIGCKRGAYGTRPAAHKAGAKARHIMERYGWYVADEELAAEIGRNVAEIINQAGLDVVCFDGADVMAGVDRDLHFLTGHQVPLSIFRHAKRDVLLISNGTTHFGWHLMARGGEDDAMARGYKRWVDDHTVHAWGASQARALLTPDLSWVGIYAHTPTLTATRPDDVEMVCARSLGFDGAIGWGFAACYGGPSTAATFSANGRRDEIAAVIRTYEKLRLDQAFTPQERLPLCEKGSEWRLLPPERPDGKYRLAPARYLRSAIVRPGVAETQSWPIENDLPPQPLRVRIEALAALASYGSKENIVLSDFAALRFETAGSPEAKVAFALTGETHPQAGGVARLACVGPAPDLRFPQQLSGNGQICWAQASALFPAKIDMGKHRAVGLWLRGDGSGAVLNVRLEFGIRSYLHFYEPITFTGWRYCELGEPEGDRVMDYFRYNKAALHDVKLGNLEGITLMILNPPRGKSVDVLVGRIEALREVGGMLENPKITVNGSTMELPVSLEPEQYLETGDLWGTPEASVCRVFDASGNELRRASLAEPPNVPSGRAEVRLAVGGQPAARAKVTVMLMGDTMH